MLVLTGEFRRGSYTFSLIRDYLLSSVVRLKIPSHLLSISSHTFKLPSSTMYIHSMYRELKLPFPTSDLFPFRGFPFNLFSSLPSILILSHHLSSLSSSHSPHLPNQSHPTSSTSNSRPRSKPAPTAPPMRLRLKKKNTIALNPINPFPKISHLIQSNSTPQF